MSSVARDRGSRPAKSATVAALLSFLWPGLGQWYAGRHQTALLYALPVAALALIVLVSALQGVQRLALQLFDPSIALTVLVLIIMLGVWRLLAILDASASVNRRTLFVGRQAQVLAILAAIVLGTHAIAGFYAWKFYENASEIFEGEVIEPTPGPSTSAEPTEELPATPFATPAPEDERITMLLTGIDKTTERTHSLTDTLLVLTVEPTTGEVAMISFPRDIARFPLYNGDTYVGKINSFYSYVERHPDEFPDGPMPSLARQLSFLLGIPIPYYSAVDLDGFRTMIDRVGGVTVNVERDIRDGRYDWLDGSPTGFFLDAGTHTLDGRTALAFVRSRQGVGDNDFTRAARQQQLLLALRGKLTDPGMLPLLPGILDAAGETIRTNFPPDQITDMLEMAQAIDDATVTRVVLQPPVYSVHPPTNSTGGIYILTLHLEAVRQLSVQLFGEDSAYWTGEFTPDGSPVPSGGGPTPAP